MDKLLSLPANGSAHGGEIDALIGWIHWLMLILFVGWGLFYVYCLIRFRRSKNPKADYKGVRNHYSSYIELAVAGIEVVLLIGFSIPIWSEAVATLPDQ
ncbi:MAG: hypothetical protein H7A33_03965, partial [Deltaproteobacteria bacterium]|nr:hypothetical protein [Deltaproteobacteria bacterium]